MDVNFEINPKRYKAKIGMPKRQFKSRTLRQLNSVNRVTNLVPPGATCSCLGPWEEAKRFSEVVMYIILKIYTDLA